MKLKVTIEENENGLQEVVIVGDAQGLEQLREACGNIMDKTGPAAHHHFEWQFNNLVPGSTPMTVRFSSVESDFID